MKDSCKMVFSLPINLVTEHRHH